MGSGTLVVVPCGKAKAWDVAPRRGAIQAKSAYIGGPFRLNRRYAEKFGDVWMILSAKYGFISPDFMIPGPYDVSFNRPSSSPIAVRLLCEQVLRMKLHRFEQVIGLGGKEYCAAIRAAFANSSVDLVFPFVGLPIGKMLAAVKSTLSHRSGGLFSRGT